MDTNIEKVNRRTVADQVFHIILKKISSGEWKIGEKIPSEIELAQDLGVSRTTLKMALQKLNTLGILETRVGEGSFVCEFSFNSLFSELLRCNLLTGNSSELNQFRVLVEYCVLRLAVLNPITEDEIDALEVHLNEMKRAIETGDEETYQVVGSQEADPMNGRISEESPFGKALLGNAVGEIVIVEAPAGNIEYEVLDIQR